MNKNNCYPFDTVCHMAKKLKDEGSKLVYVHGIFDILHEGHLSFLHAAKKIGDVLIVGLDADWIAKQVKGKNRPLRSFKERSVILSYFNVIDFIFEIDGEETKDLDAIHEKIYLELNPNFLATCFSSGKHGDIKSQRAASFGIEFVDIETEYANASTTNFIKKVIDSNSGKKL